MKSWVGGGIEGRRGGREGSGGRGGFGWVVDLDANVGRDAKTYRITTPTSM